MSATTVTKQDLSPLGSARRLNAIGRQYAVTDAEEVGLSDGTMEKAAATASTIDAEMIAACDRIMVIERKELAIYATRHTKEDEIRTESAIDALRNERSILIERIQDMPSASTIAGLRALARAAMALAPKDSDGDAYFGGGDAEQLGFEITRALIERGAA